MVPGRRKRPWLIPAAAIAVLAALVVHGWDKTSEWLRWSAVFERTVAKGATADYAGARWRLLGLGKLVDMPDGAALYVAEFEAQVTDAAAFSQQPCFVALEAPGPVRWMAQFTPPERLRKARPDLVDVPACGAAKTGEAANGQKIRMKETFLMPAARFESVRLRISQPPGLPDYLVFDHN